jgi:hypothetical protein
VLAGAIGGCVPLPHMDTAGLFDAAIAEGVAALLADSPAIALLGDERDRLREHARADAIRLAALDAELGRVLEALSRDAITPLLLKGAHLAYAVYPRPWLRPRTDTDLLIGAADRDRVADALSGCGYVPAVHVRGRLILGQCHFARIDRSGIASYLDVHWRVGAPLLIDRVLPSRLFFETATALPALGPHARVPDLPLALLLACLHLAAHHRSNPRLVWLYDLRLLADALDEEKRRAFVALARRAECCAIAAHALDASRRLFDSVALHDLAARLSAQPPRREASAALLRVNRPAGALWIDLRAAGWRDRALLLREHLLPDREYMSTRSGPLPLAYAVRAATGARRWLRRNW